jgi:hypothetical protein
MNLVNTSRPTPSRPTPLRPGRRGFDELVPSRYALRVGEIDVLVISDGVLPLPTVTMATNADPTVRAAWLNEMFLPPDGFDWPLNVAVVRSGDRTILIDAGLGQEFPGFPRAGQLVLRLEAAGIGLASVLPMPLASVAGEKARCKGSHGPSLFESRAETKQPINDEVVLKLVAYWAFETGERSCAAERSTIACRPSQSRYPLR